MSLVQSPEARPFNTMRHIRPNTIGFHDFVRGLRDSPSPTGKGKKRKPKAKSKEPPGPGNVIHVGGGYLYGPGVGRKEDAGDDAAERRKAARAAAIAKLEALVKRISGDCDELVRQLEQRQREQAKASHELVDKQAREKTLQEQLRSCEGKVRELGTTHEELADANEELRRRLAELRAKRERLAAEAAAREARRRGPQCDVVFGEPGAPVDGREVAATRRQIRKFTERHGKEFGFAMSKHRGHFGGGGASPSPRSPGGAPGISALAATRAAAAGAAGETGRAGAAVARGAWMTTTAERGQMVPASATGLRRGGGSRSSVGSIGGSSLSSSSIFSYTSSTKSGRGRRPATANAAPSRR
jgi:hypothetical protein